MAHNAATATIAASARTTMRLPIMYFPPDRSTFRYEHSPVNADDVSIRADSQRAIRLASFDIGRNIGHLARLSVVLYVRLDRKSEARMIAVIFEVWPADGRKDDYLDHAARLREELLESTVSFRWSVSRA